MNERKIVIGIFVAGIVVCSIIASIFILSTNQSATDHPMLQYRTTLRPIADHNLTGCNEGALYNCWFPLSGTFNWMNVDDITPDGTQTCLVINSSVNFDYFQLGGSLDGIGNIQNITVHAIISTDTVGVNDFSMEIWKNTAGVGTPNKMVKARYPDWEDFNYTFDVNPWTEQRWTVDDLKDMEVQIYVGDIVSNVYCTQVYVDVNYGEYTFLQTRAITR